MKTMFLTGALALAASGLAHAGEFKVESGDFSAGTVEQAQFSAGFGCTGGNLSPDVRWSNAPAGTRSFVVTLYDGDAPTGSGWWHWVVIDIPAGESGLKTGVGTGKGLPDGAKMIRNDAGTPDYMGVCPPPGQKHRYTITVKALKVDRLAVPPDASAALVGFVSNMNALATATIEATAGR
jgi:Raf kinase inhibitor-like YbhB/YbcL family protein